MDKIKTSPLLLLIARLVLAGIFTIAALSKIQAPIVFANSIVAFHVIGPELSKWVALLLPWLELVTALGLLVPWLRRSSGLCISLMLIVFIGLHTRAWIYGLDINCGCFGKEAAAQEFKYFWLIFRNCGLLVACAYLYISDSRNDRLIKQFKA